MIDFVLAPEYQGVELQGATVAYGDDRQMFDIVAALAEGNGKISTDDQGLIESLRGHDVVVQVVEGAEPVVVEAPPAEPTEEEKAAEAAAEAAAAAQDQADLDAAEAAEKATRTSRPKSL